MVAEGPASTRDRLERTALHLFRDRGFDKVTIEEICRTASVAPATFYRQFGTKERVVFGYADDFSAAMDAAVESVDPAWPRGRQLIHVVSTFAAFLEANQDVLALRDAIVLDHPALLRYAVAIQRDLEMRLADDLARRRRLAAVDDGIRAEAAVALVVLRLGLRSWRAGRCASLTAAVGEALAECRSVLNST